MCKISIFLLRIDLIMRLEMIYFQITKNYCKISKVIHFVIYKYFKGSMVYCF